MLRVLEKIVVQDRRDYVFIRGGQSAATWGKLICIHGKRTAMIWSSKDGFGWNITAESVTRHRRLKACTS